MMALTAVPATTAAQDSGNESGKTPLGATMSGKATIGTDAGKIEARLLSGLVVKQTASRIVDAIGTDYTSLAFVVLPLPKEEANSGDFVGGAGWDVIQSVEKLPVVDDMMQVREAIEGFRMRYAGIAAVGIKVCRAGVQKDRFGASATDFLGSATSVLNAATPLLNLFKQDFTYSGHTLRIRDGMLVSAIRGEIATRRKPPAAATMGPRNFSEAIEIVGKDITSLPEAARCPEDGGAEQTRQRLEADFERFRGELAQPGSEEGLSLLKAAESQLRRYGLRPATLVLAIDANGASFVQKSNLFTMFGAETFTISSGIVVSYEFYEPQSGGMRSLRAAGVLSCMSGAVGLRRMHKAKEVNSQATCY